MTPSEKRRPVITRPGMTLTAIHLAGNAAMLWLGYYWLGVGESRAVTLLWSAFLALLLVGLACWLHGATFAYFVGRVPDLPAAFRTALRNLPAIIAAALVVFAVYQLLAWWANYSAQPAFQLSSWLTLKLRKPVKPNTVLRAFNDVLWVVRWVIVPVLVLPMIAGVASRGWGGFGQFGKLNRKGLYWLQAPVLLVCALWVPFWLIGWVPQAGSFAMEIVSFAMRFLAAYLLFVGSWLLLAFLTSVGSPVLSQSKTAVSP